MKIQYFSDIHTEHHMPERDLAHPEADLIVAAGDIGNGVVGLQWLQRKFPHLPVIYVPGNHEGYGEDFPSVRRALHNLSKGTNVFLLDNSAIEIAGITFMGGTLWTDFRCAGRMLPSIPQEIGAAAVKNNINDQKWIRWNGENFTAEQWLTEHNATVDFLAEKFKTIDGPKTVVVTHHLPFVNSISPEFEGSYMNAGFCSDLSRLLWIGSPKYWFHGHTHRSCDYELGETRVLCNPRGYTRSEDRQENPDFDWLKIVEI